MTVSTFTSLSVVCLINRWVLIALSLPNPSGLTDLIERASAFSAIAFIGVQSAGGKHRARGAVNRTGKAADGNFFAAQLSDCFKFRSPDQSEIGKFK